MTTRSFYSVTAGFAILDVPGCFGGGPGRPPNGCSGRTASGDKDDIGGTVTSTKGPEAGVWVIAETTDLPTRYIKDRGHRRSWPLSDSRSAPGQLHRLGAGIRPGGFAKGKDRARQSGRFETDGGAG